MRQRALIQDRQSDIECELSDTYSELALAKEGSIAGMFMRAHLQAQACPY